MAHTAAAVAAAAQTYTATLIGNLKLLFMTHGHLLLFNAA